MAVDYLMCAFLGFSIVVAGYRNNRNGSFSSIALPVLEALFWPDFWSAPRTGVPSLMHTVATAGRMRE